MRKKRKKKKIYFPDPKFNDSLVTRFVNHLMKNGKKNLAYKIFYDAMKKIEQIKEKEEKSALEIWKVGLKNVMPHVEVISRRMGGSNIQVPIIISPDSKITKGMKLLISCAAIRNEKSMSNKLAFEIFDAFKEQGEAVKRKENIHKMAEANKAFSHFRF
ncbi:MAG: 30S ribosomal protein S7 [Flavobacteriales bacterium]|jgi:small subunit ribosomal protein S7|uniref:30S ribosomal protein S7 n=1 Tax=Blattabacterium sp. (Mastotermes darwiniensis) TaxID=39768 RepID=UPI000231DE76|nr:30S ribosomal protein S7 [Blattabacterium sp. (Mastotermes darwiniensis)]AER40682.1 30S ribosomal protein S7 [Blattabacterium sp. (Mastotermes darwiniensis) str. MADAR]MDR1804790.1 30S ribosomal protein S7 [Flavobacteriales bacterium]